jgi:predicted MFS family arabinose efflux permease
MTTSLFALQLGGSEFTVGLLMALFALLPMLLSVSVGRLIDRVGPRRPILLAYGALAAGTALPFAFPDLVTLYFSCTLVGTSFMYIHIAMNSVFGAYGTPEQRAVNFSWLALGFSISNSLGPLVAGFAIDHFGHAQAMATLGAFPLLALLLVWLRRRPLPRPEAVPPGKRSGVLDLLRIPALRHTFIVSVLLSTGWDLYTFLTPLYGARLGFAATTIGIIMSTFALATFAVRLTMPYLVKRLRQWVVISFALALSGAAYLLFPYVSSVALLMTLSFVLGMGLGCAQPIVMSLLYETSPPGRQGEAVGLRTSLMNGSHTLIPLASGALSAAAGMTPVFWILAAFLLGGAWFARRRIKATAA